jgi:hypothetical protein
MIHKKFKDFIKESNIVIPSVELIDLDKSVRSLRYDIGSINDYEMEFLSKFNIFLCYTFDFAISGLKFSICFSKIATREIDIDKIIESSLDKLSIEDAWEGFDWNYILSNKKIILDNIGVYDSLNGIADIILYKLDSKYLLSGNDKDYHNSYDEILIKYTYGYHKTHWGKVFLDQYYGGVDKYFDTIKKEILIIFSDFINISERKSVLSEVIEDNYLTDIDGDKVRIYFEEFYHIIDPMLDIGRIKRWNSGLKSLKNSLHKWMINFDKSFNANDNSDYEIFKKYFIFWILENYQIKLSQIEDEYEYIDVYIYK